MPASAVAALASVLWLLAGCAAQAPHETYGLDEAGGRLVRDTCHEVMGLTAGESHFDGCARSLADSLQTVARETLMAGAHQSCRSAGLREGSADFAQCVLNHIDAGDAHARTIAAAAPAGGKFVSYFKMNPSVRFQREQQSCARLGLDPVGSDFTSCVTGLTWTFFDLDNPSS